MVRIGNREVDLSSVLAAIQTIRQDIDELVTGETVAVAELSPLLTRLGELLDILAE